MNIVEKVEALMEIIDDAKMLIRDIQNNQCKHPNYTAKYERCEDDYWVIINCPDCCLNKIHESKDAFGERDDVYYKNHERVIK